MLPLSKLEKWNNSSQPVLRQSERVTRDSDRYVPSLDYVMLTDCDEPSCYKEAMQREDKDKWEKAMQSTMYLLRKNSTWELVHLPCWQEDFAMQVDLQAKDHG